MTELEKAAFEQEFDKLWFGNLEEYFNHDAADYANIRNIALHFVNWQYEQFEKERLNFEPRLKHCDELTAEQAQIESDFVVQHLKKCNRTPTFIDAIEYGRRLMIDKACDWLNNFYSEDRNAYLVKEDIEAFKQAMEE